MRKFIPSTLSFLFACHFVSAQCPVAGFSNPSSSCAGQPVNLTNLSSGASHYQWDFCAGDFNSTPTGADDPSSPAGPVSMNVVFDDTNWYGFVATSNNHILRYEFGSSLANTPAGPFDLGNPGNSITGSLFNEISFMRESGRWFGTFAVATGYRVITLAFDSSLTNPAPAASVFTDPIIPAYVEMQDMKIDHDSIFLFVGNDNYNQILVLKYGTSILNTPVADTILLPAGYSNMEDISLVKTCDHWYGYGVIYSSGVIIKLDFGNSLNNHPVITGLGNPGNVVVHPYSIVVANDGLQWVAFVMNYANGLVKIKMGTDISNPVLNASLLSFPTLNGIGTSVNIAKENSSFYLFTSNYGGNAFSKIKYAAPCSAVPPVSSDSLPAILYSTSGTYQVSCAVTDANGNMDYHHDSITINYAPVSNFSVMNTCLGDVTVFTDSSTIVSGGSITGRSWDFGDSNTSGAVSPTHAYATAGTYTVSLTTTANNGCANIKTELVNITPRPVANFSAPPACSETPVQFTDLSTIVSGSIADWHWDFGNTDTSLSSSPLYAYPAGGNYSVTLKVTSAAGCSDSISNPLSIAYRPQAAFTATNTCIGQSTQFTDHTVSQSPVTWHSWNFGDSNTDTIQLNPSHLYPAAVAVYTVTYIVQSANGCADTVIQPVKINNVPSANFSYAPVNICENNNVFFTDLSTVAGDTISGWLWDFGDAVTDTVQNPVHQYALPGNYTVTLIAYSPSSCGNSFSQNINVIQSPTAAFTFTNVCLGNATQFTDQSSTPTGIIDSLFWNFGDSTGDSVSINPAHTFQTPGNHFVTLSIKTNSGCMNSVTMLVAVHPVPEASFVNTSPCTHSDAQFTSTSTIDSTSSIQSYLWNFGEPGSGSNNTSILSNPTHLYDTTGNFIVSLITTSNFGCTDTAISVLNVLPGSLANFQSSPTCFGDLVIFTNLSTGNSVDSAYIWNFGDGSGPNFLPDPAHLYALAGTYFATLTVYAHSGCISNSTRPVTVSPIPVAAFVDAPACIGTTYHFLDSSYIAAGSITEWNWNIAGLDSDTVQNPFFTFPDTGNYSVTLSVKSDIGCANNITQIVHVYPLPVANFSFSPPFGPPPLNVTFSNLSTGANTYSWNFGDSTAASSMINPQHLYTGTSLFPIQLIAISQYGCKDTMVKNIFVVQPTLDLAVTNLADSIGGNHLFITCSLANLGTQDISNFKIEAQIEGGTPIQESYTQQLANGYSGQLRLATAFDLGSGQARYYCVSALDPNGKTDDNVSNNELCKSLTKEFSVIDPYPNPFSENFLLQLILPYKDHVSIELFDMTGKQILIFDGEGHEGLNEYQADPGFLAGGMYALRIRFREQEVIKTVMKMENKK